MKKLEKKYKERYGERMAPVEKMLTLMNYFVNNFTSYNYNSTPNVARTSGRTFEFDFDEVKVDGWGMRVEFDPTVEHIYSQNHNLGGWNSVEKKNFEKDDYYKAQWIEHYINDIYNREHRDQWLLVYEWFNKKKPDWLEGRNECYYRIIQEQGLVDGMMEHYARVYGEDYDPYIFYGKGYEDRCSEDSSLRLEDVKVKTRRVK